MVRITVMIPEEIKDSLDKIAKEKDRSFAYVVRTALEQYLQEKEPVQKETKEN